MGWRLTKYDPRNRNAAGHYLKDDWTCVSEIGKSFEGKMLTAGEYLRVESAYIDTIMDLHAEAGAPDLIARGVESHRFGEPGGPSDLAGDIVERPPLEGQIVSHAALTALVRTCLRGLIWCRLEAAGRSFIVHFGYDYYVYVTGVDPSAAAKAVARERGLYLEPFESPFLRTVLGDSWSPLATGSAGMTRDRFYSEALALADRLVIEARFDLQRVDRAIGVVFLITDFDYAVRIGGIEGWLSSSAGERAVEAGRALDEIGAVQCAELVRLALSLFPFGAPALGIVERAEQVQQLRPKAEATWLELERRLLKWPDDTDALLRTYVERHASAFSRSLRPV